MEDPPSPCFVFSSYTGVRGDLIELPFSAIYGFCVCLVPNEAWVGAILMKLFCYWHSSINKIKHFMFKHSIWTKKGQLRNAAEVESGQRDEGPLSGCNASGAKPPKQINLVKVNQRVWLCQCRTIRRNKAPAFVLMSIQSLKRRDSAGGFSRFHKSTTWKRLVEQRRSSEHLLNCLLTCK